MSLPFWLLSTLCPILPDLDVIGFRLDYLQPFPGASGFLSFPFFCSVGGVVYAFIYLRKNQTTWKTRVFVYAYFFLLTASNGLLDIFTNGGMGVALLSLFDTTRYFFPWRPIQVSPIGIGGFLGYVDGVLENVNLLWYGCLLYLFCY